MALWMKSLINLVLKEEQMEGTEASLIITSYQMHHQDRQVWMK